MAVIATFMLLLLQAPPQVPKPEAKAVESAAGLGIRQDPNTGWPAVEGGVVPTPVAAPRPSPPPAAPAVESARATPLASGADIGSPLLPVYQRIGTPGRFRDLGGVTVWLRLSIYGPQGEVIGIREITETADLSRPDRDRLEYADGRVYGRSGAVVFAARGSLPWPTWNDAAGQELELFGLLLRAPWCFGDSSAFTIIGRDYHKRGGVQLLRLQLERRLDGDDAIGPAAAPRPRDRFELWCDGTGQPCEFVHTLASSQQTRRVLLEDWQEKAPGVWLPCRRVYVDDQGRQTTTMEILRLERTPLQDRDFRL